MMHKKPLNLRDWLLKQTNFPGRGNRDYCSQFRAFESYMFKEVHPQIEKLAMSVEGGFLTDHGVEHIRTVIDRSCFMLGPKPLLSAYEVYVLLAAIHLHDVGNIYGRAGHETNHVEVLRSAGNLLGTDSAEIRLIQQIAAAHGGRDEDGNSADRLGRLQEEEHFLNEDVRVQALAAILRFADELADDTDRAGRLAILLNRIPEEAEIYHQYALHLSSVKVRLQEKCVDLRFNLDGDIACRSLKKNGQECLLLDEIYDRTLKMHRELIYCSRYMRSLVWLDAINVKIDVFLHSANINPVEVIRYSLREVGYPQRLPDIKQYLTQPSFDGFTLKARLEAESKLP